MSGDGDFLSRWSRRKHQARKGEAPAEPAPAADALPPASVAPAAIPAPAEEQPLPSVESLTPQSDFTPFMKPDVDLGLRNQALKTLFRDPQFNVMDGLDVYIEDYSKPDPLPEGWLEKMTQVSRLGAYEPPKEPAEEAAETQPAEEAGEAQPVEEPAPCADAIAAPGEEPSPEAESPGPDRKSETS